MPQLLWWRNSPTPSYADDEYDDSDDEFDATAMTANKTNLMPHDEFLKRIRKTLYVGGIPCSAPSTNSQKISRPLADYAAQFYSESHRGHSLNRLSSVTVAKLNSSPCSLILAMIYMERLRAADPLFARLVTPTELFLVSMLVSSKFYYGYDECTFIEDFVAASDDALTTDTLKQLELDLLDALDWNVYVSNADFFAKLCAVERELAQRQGCARGWLTYTELAQLFPSLAIGHAFLKYSAVFAVSYAASVFTIAGAFLVASQVPGSALYRHAEQTSSIVPTAATTMDTSSGSGSTMMATPMADRVNEMNETVVDGVDEEVVETEQDRSFGRLRQQFDIVGDVSMGATNHSTFRSSRKLPAAIENDDDAKQKNSSAWMLLVELARLQFAVDSAIKLRGFIGSTSSAMATTATTTKNDSCSTMDHRRLPEAMCAVNRTQSTAGWSEFDSMARTTPDTTCRRANGYGTLLDWMQFM